MTNEDVTKMSDVLLQSLYDYHFAYNGGSYTLPKTMLDADITSKLAIDSLIENGYAVDNGEGSDNLVLSITPKGLDSIKNKQVK
ncbi:hypothetical protein [Sporosarcina gallistercoris]|uniref:Uncharacterized protein n=1 Tax=Sporosarcina gallistercoris TaxID=2762245 RepID=A0ABR8PN67_9BACL|nr:hypothetical protein [Sporosarcina gallistercoris]MBD7909634.1 hypothetical protein [Sporosarcina gallistercoris]